MWQCGFTKCDLSPFLSAEPIAAVGEEADAVDTGIRRESSSEIALTSQILAVLKERPAPELSLSSQDLEVGKNQGQ